MKLPLPGISSSPGRAPELKGWGNRGKLRKYLEASAPVAKGSHMVKCRVTTREKYTLPTGNVARMEENKKL